MSDHSPPGIAAAASLPPIVTARQLADLFQVCTKTIHVWVAEGKLPRPIQCGRNKRWYLSQILTHIGGGAA
jgi:predicted DNA-binding transcriptional regulator AlpA